MSARRLGLLAALLLATVATACGSGSGGEGERPRLTVSAATSLKGPLSETAPSYTGADVRLGFGGSDELAAQIRQGVEPDVFAAANTALPDALAEEGLVERPVVFARNRLVVALPPEGSPVRTFDDLRRAGLTIALGAPTVPVGAYARTVLDRLPPAQRTAILGNVRSEEPDVGGVVGKLTQGAVDAGFVYATDVRAAGLRTIEIPEALQPEVAYAAAVVKGSAHADAARAYVEDLAEGTTQEALRAAGFLPPP